MHQIKSYLLVFFLLTVNLCAFSQEWRSELYPFDWEPGYAKEGKFLHDFSYAGYHRGEKDIPFREHSLVDVTQAPFYADNTGKEDATAAIQAAIDSVATLGGGIVYLPEGTYTVKPTASAALTISHNNTVMRGDGTDKTFILNTETSMRYKTIIEMSPVGNNHWFSPDGPKIYFTSDASEQDTLVYLSDVSEFSPGDRIVLTTDFTTSFIEEHMMSGKWKTSMQGVAFCRTIKAVDSDKNALILDIPLRYYMKVRDNARAYKIKEQLTECGLENLSIANIQSSLSGLGDTDYNEPGTAAYEVHGSHAIVLKYAENCWVKNVATFRPSDNASDYHVLSNVLQLYQSRLITVDSCNFQKPQYEGGGGNGYMYILQGNDCKISNSTAVHARHNFDFKKPFSNGNVIYNCLSKDARLASDFHMHLSMSNLFDNHTVDKDFLEAVYRPYGTVEHGHTTTQSVFWNTKGEQYHSGGNYIVKSEQWGYGYVIGTRGAATGVQLLTGHDTEPLDHLEGMGKGASLHPQSLYKDQLNRRLSGLSAVDSAGWDVPEIAMVSPTLDETIASGEDVYVEVEKLGEKGFVEQVVFFNGDEQLGEDSEAPYTLRWSGVANGCYTISAYAISPTGFPSNREVREVIVGRGCEESFNGAIYSLPTRIEAENFNKGKNGLSYFDTDEANQGNVYRLDEPVDIQASRDAGGGYNIGWIADGEFLRYMVNIPQAGQFDIHFRIAGPNGGSISLKLLEQGLEETIEVPATEDWQKWETIHMEGIALEEGIDTLQLTFSGSFNLNYFEFTEAITTGFQEDSEKGRITLFPNPVQDELHVHATGSPITQYAIYNMLGKVLYADNLVNTDSPITIKTNELQAGTYFIRLHNNKGSILTRMFIKQ